MLLTTLFQLTTSHKHGAKNGGCYNYSPCDLCVYGLGKADDYINKSINNGIVDFRQLWDKAMDKLDGKYFGAPWVYRDTSMARLIKQYLLTPDSQYANNDKKKDAIIKSFVWAAMTKDPRLGNDGDTSSTVWNFFSQFKCSASDGEEGNRMTKLLTSNAGASITAGHPSTTGSDNIQREIITPHYMNYETKDEGEIRTERWNVQPEKPTIDTSMHTMAKSSNVLTDGGLRQYHSLADKTADQGAYPALNNNQQQQPAINTWIWDGMQALRDIFCQNKSFHTIGGVEELDWLDDYRWDIKDYVNEIGGETYKTIYNKEMTRGSIGLNMGKYLNGQTIGGVKWKGLKATWKDGTSGERDGWYEAPSAPSGIDEKEWSDSFGYATQHHPGVFAQSGNQTFYGSVDYNSDMIVWHWKKWENNERLDATTFNITRIVRELTDADKKRLSQSTIQYLQHTPSLRQLVRAVVEYFMTYGWYEAREAKLEEWGMSEDEYRAWLYTSKCADLNICYAPSPLPTNKPTNTKNTIRYADTSVTDRAGIWNNNGQCMMKGVETWAINEVISTVFGKNKLATSTLTTSLINKLLGNVNVNHSNICNGNETDCNITLTTTNTNNNDTNNNDNDRVTVLTIVAVTCGLACIACVAVMVGMVHGINKKKKESLSSMLSIDSMFGKDHTTTPRPYVDSNLNTNNL